MLNAHYHRVFVHHVCVYVSFFCGHCTVQNPTTAEIDGERYTAVVFLSGYGCCWSSGASSRTDTQWREKEREREPRTQLSHMKLHTHARDVKTADPPLLHRALLVAPLPCPHLCRSHPLSITALSLSLSLSLSLPLILPTLVVSRWITSRTKDT